jgi:hypothetical protein
VKQLNALNLTLDRLVGEVGHPRVVHHAEASLQRRDAADEHKHEHKRGDHHLDQAKAAA